MATRSNEVGNDDASSGSEGRRESNVGSDGNNNGSYVASYGPGHIRLTDREIRTIVWLLNNEYWTREMEEYKSDMTKDILALAEYNSDRSPNALAKFNEYQAMATLRDNLMNAHNQIAKYHFNKLRSLQDYLEDGETTL